jgi:hypothetical protein
MLLARAKIDDLSHQAAEARLASEARAATRAPLVSTDGGSGRIATGALTPAGTAGHGVHRRGVLTKRRLINEQDVTL